MVSSQMATITPSPFLFIQLVILSIPCAVEAFHSLHPHKNNASDEQALLAFRAAIKYDQENSFVTWAPNISFCKWRGVSCSVRRQRVSSLSLPGVGLVGTISPFLGNLSFLRILDLSNNSLDGHIPYQLQSLSRLEYLGLHRNRLEGSIPPTLSACHSLIHLNVWDNHLTGNIPSVFGSLFNLNFIQLSRNNLTGIIPNSLGNISSLNYLDLSENKLEGQIPQEMGALSLLNLVDLGGNHLTGEIPSSLSNCTALETLALTDNHLSGEISREFCSKNTLLRQLYLAGNRLSGEIPVTLFNCSQLQILSLENNQLSGVVPIELGKLHELTILSLWANQFVSGSNTNLPFLTALTNCSLLQALKLSYNYLSGTLPSSVGQLSTKLDILYFDFNNIEGKIPPQIGNLTNLSTLSLHQNLLTGAVPSTVGMLQRLDRLYLSKNKLHGNIPVEIGQLKSLGFLALYENKFDGNIPASLEHLQQMRYLYLDHNQLTGTIPSSLGKCTKLEDLDISHNRLRGHVPPQLVGLQNIAFELDLSNNLLEGPLPLELGNMEKVQGIDISANQLTGNIPSTIGSCIAVEILNLSFNKLNGSISESLGKLLNLQDLDLSFNNLSGKIPMSLGKLKALQHLNFSSNKLEGEVPRDGVFKKHGAISLFGNVGLCGPWVKLPVCATPQPQTQSQGHLKRVLIPIGAAVFVTWCVLMGFLWRCYCKRRPIMPQLFELGPRRISLQDLLTASDGFNEANLIGSGSSGKVYRGVLKDGTMVAIKVFDLQNEDALKIFVKECKVLRRVRHRNLVRIITSYSDPDCKALIFPLMPNGNLDKLLHPPSEHSSQGQLCSLDLIQRLRILMDIAQGMEYLHHHCFVQVIHCDLKPSNVLLGEDMSAYLTDFGISRLYPRIDGDSLTTSTLRGSIGYVAPEYGTSGVVTTKGDVYSYGIVLLEMLTGKKPTNSMFVEGMNLPNWVSRCFPDTIEEVLDSHLLSAAVNGDEGKMLNCLKQLICLGLLCTKDFPEERPSMIDIVRILGNIRDTFLGTASIPTLQSDFSHLLGSTSGPHKSDESQSSSF